MSIIPNSETCLSLDKSVYDSIMVSKVNGDKDFGTNVDNLEFADILASLVERCLPLQSFWSLKASIVTEE